MEKEKLHWKKSSLSLATFIVRNFLGKNPSFRKRKRKRRLIEKDGKDNIPRTNLMNMLLGYLKEKISHMWVFFDEIDEIEKLLRFWNNYKFLKVKESHIITFEHVTIIEEREGDGT